MHCNNVVVALVDDNKRPLREHDAQRLGSSPAHRAKGIQTGRSCRVLMPFETEFKILVKNQNNCRVKLDVTIDGATVTGAGLIIGSHMSEYIERSVDVSQKFKFVSANHEDVSDPTNEENGNIVVTVWKEKDCRNETIWKEKDWRNETVWPQHYGPYWNNNSLKECSSIPMSTSDWSGSNINVSNMSIKSVVPKGDAGAVIDGSDSYQTFGNTTWRGNDGPANKFIFFVRGVEKTLSIHEQNELEELARLKAKYEG